MVQSAAVALRTAWRPTPGLIEHMNVPRGRAQIGLAEPVHHRLWVLPSVDQPQGVRVPDLVGGRLERDPAFLDRA